MKILNAGHHYHIKGGSDRYLMNLETLLQGQGHEVIPFAAEHPDNEPTPYSQYFPAAGIATQGTNPKTIAKLMYNPTVRKQVDALLQDHPVDLAHLHIYYGKLTTALLDGIRKHNVPIVQTCHEYKLICPVYTLISQGEICTACQGHKFYKGLVKKCNKGSLARSLGIVLESYASRWNGDNRKVDHFITVSEFQRQQIVEMKVVPEDKITTVHNFLDPTNFTPHYTPGDYLLFFGRLDATKGVLTLVKAMQQLPDVQLKIAGDGALRPTLEAYIAEHKMTNVEIVGFKSGAALAEIIQNSRCNVIPSEWYETFGLTTIESNAYGKPVVGSRIGGIQEVIADGETGWFFEPGHVNELAEKLRWMMDHPTEVEAMGRKARAHVEQYFSPKPHYRQLMDVYAKVL